MNFQKDFSSRKFMINYFCVETFIVQKFANFRPKKTLLIQLSCGFAERSFLKMHNAFTSKFYKIDKQQKLLFRPGFLCSGGKTHTFFSSNNDEYRTLNLPQAKFYSQVIPQGCTIVHVLNFFTGVFFLR